MIKKFFTVMIAFLLVFLFPVNVLANDFDSLIRIYDQEASVECLNRFLSEFDETEYAGAYIDDFGGLVINLLENNHEQIEFINNENDFLFINKIDTRVRYDFAKNSLSYLKSVVKKFEEHLSPDGVFSVSIDEEKNKIVLDMYCTSDMEEKSALKLENLINSLGYCTDDEMFNINKTDCVLQTTASIRPGSKFKIGSSSFTVAWGAKIEHSGGNKGKYVFLIPGHCSSVNNSVYFGSTYVGKVIERDFGGSYDVGYVENSNHSMGAVFSNAETLPYGSPYRNPPQGLIITSYGSVSGKQSGKILQTNYSTTVDNVQLSGVYKASYKAIGGDSGAPVFSSSPVGMQSCSLLSNGNWVSSSYSIFVPMYNICERNSIHDIFLTTF